MKIKAIVIYTISCILFFTSCTNQDNRHTSQQITAEKHDPITVDVIVPEHGMADPHAWVQNDTVYIICGHDESWEGKGSFRMDRWEVWSSTDLKKWNYHRSIYPKDTYIGDHPNCWAGDICERDGQYYWFFSNRNINTGILRANTITGKYIDILGKPLLPKGIVPVHAYDPEIYIENDVYTISFGAGQYYMATLAEDMMSLTTDPKPILVRDKKGDKMGVGDKSSLFKRHDWYYLVWGDKYAMSKNLYGPYDFKGSFLKGGHTSFFEWKEQLYVLQENHDISAFYRGASLKPVFFNEDETILIPKEDRMYPGPGRPFKFKASTMGWNTLDGSPVQFSNGKISFNLSDNLIIQSAPWLYTDTRECSEVTFKIKNKSDATEMMFAIHSRNHGKDFWSKGTGQIDWSQKEWISIPITANDTEFKTYSLRLNQLEEVNDLLMQIAIQPAVGISVGSWEIDEIIVK